LIVNEPLSDEAAFARARAVQRVAVVAGLIAVVVTWKIGLRWYCVIPSAFLAYFLVGFIAAVLGVRNPPVKRSNEIPIGLPYESPWTEEEKKALFGDRSKNPPTNPSSK
jgi:hypothetical protein